MVWYLRPSDSRRSRHSAASSASAPTASSCTRARLAPAGTSAALRFPARHATTNTTLHARTAGLGLAGTKAILQTATCKDLPVQVVTCCSTAMTGLACNAHVLHDAVALAQGFVRTGCRRPVILVGLATGLNPSFTHKRHRGAPMTYMQNALPL